MKDKNHMISLICGIITKKKDKDELICRTETDLEKIMVTKGNRWGQGKEGLGLWDWHMHTEVYGMIG